jgi:4'-phosphopantetheinyl transferase
MLPETTAPRMPILPRKVLGDCEAALWWMAVESPPAATVARWFAMLDEHERARADRFHFAADRDIYIAAHALTRALLTHVHALPAPAWRFVTAPTGKPEIAAAFDQPKLRFNLSHTRGLVACVVGFDHDLGIDVEANDRCRNELRLAARFFASDEVSLLRRIAEDERRKAFFRIWTLKEAYIKATGQGLACPLDSFAFGLDPITIRFCADCSEDPATWQFVQFDPTPRHVISLAARHASTPLRVSRRTINFDEL